MKIWKELPYPKTGTSTIKKSTCSEEIKRSPRSNNIIIISCLTSLSYQNIYDSCTLFIIWAHFYKFSGGFLIVHCPDYALVFLMESTLDGFRDIKVFLYNIFKYNLITLVNIRITSGGNMNQFAVETYLKTTLEMIFCVPKSSHVRYVIVLV